MNTSGPAPETASRVDVTHCMQATDLGSAHMHVHVRARQPTIEARRHAPSARRNALANVASSKRTEAMAMAKQRSMIARSELDPTFTPSTPKVCECDEKNANLATFTAPSDEDLAHPLIVTLHIVEPSLTSEFRGRGPGPRLRKPNGHRTTSCQAADRGRSSSSLSSEHS